MSALEVAVPSQDSLGECPVWDDRTGTLWRVDALAGAVHAVDVASGTARRYDVGRHVGSLVLTDGPGQLLLAAQGGFFRLDTSSGDVELLAPLHERDADLLLNDGACDPAGRFVAGTMRRDARPGSAGLYRYAPPSGVVPLLEGAGVSNGLGWSADGAVLHWVDTLLGRVERLGYDVQTGTVTSRAPAFDLSGWAGVPDGMAVDAQGCLWIAFWRGGAVRRFASDGRLLDEVLVPVSRTTSCCLGGDDLRDLYVTTARRSVRDAPRDVEPWAGAVLRVRVDVPGLPVRRWDPAA